MTQVQARPLLRRPKSPVRALGAVLLGNLVGQGVVLVTMPLLAHLYTPRDFGALAVVTSVSAVTGAIATLSWERAIVASRSDRLARALAWLASASALAVAAALSLLAFAARGALDRLFTTDVFDSLWWAVPAGTVALSAQRIMAQMLVRRRQFAGLGARNAAQGLVQTSTSVAASSITGPFGLVIGPIAGRLAGSLGGWVVSRDTPASSAARPPAGWKALGARVGGGSRRRDLRVAAARYRRFPLLSTWSSALNALGIQLPVIILAATLGPIEVGFVALASRLIAAPVGVLSDSLAAYYDGTLGSALRARRPGISGVTARLMLASAAVGTVLVVTTALLGETAFGLAFGPAWTAAAPIATIMAVQAAAQLVASPVSRALVILEQQRLQLTWDASRFVLVNGALVAAATAGFTSTALVTVWAATALLSYGALALLVIMALRRWERRVL